MKNSQSEQPQPTVNTVIDLRKSISAKDLEKIQQHQASTKGAYSVDDEWLIMCEWLRLAGYKAYQDAKTDKLPLAEILTLIEANRRIEAAHHYKNAEAAFIGAGSAQSKKPASTFKKLVKGIINMTKADEE